jgi:hypothetical protein
MLLLAGRSTPFRRLSVRKIPALLGIVAAVGVAYALYQTYLSRSGTMQAPPQQQIDVVGIRTTLLAMAQAERQYLVAHSTYGTLEQLQQDGLLTGGAQQRGYTFSVAADGARGFSITATPSDTDKTGWPTLTIDETMQVTQR